jgi:uncharacterized membrane protein YfhO
MILVCTASTTLALVFVGMHFTNGFNNLRATWIVTLLITEIGVETWLMALETTVNATPTLPPAIEAVCAPLLTR